MENLSFELKELYNGKDYDGVINLANGQDGRNGFNEWSYYYLTDSYYKKMEYSEALKVGKEFLNKFTDSKDPKMNNKIGWCLYYTKIKNFDKDKDDINEFIKVVDYVAKTCVQDQYSPYKIILLRLLKIVFDKGNKQVNYEMGNKYLSLLDPMLLSDEEVTTEIDGRTMKISSERETWYGRQTKTLLALKNYNECLKEANEALVNVEKFHNNDKEWIQYRQATCYLYLNDLVKSEEILNEILLTFAHWCIYEKLYEIENKKNNYEKALKYASTASLADKEHKLRVSFYKDFGDFLSKNENKEASQYHYKLVDIIRKENNWKEDKNIEQLITSDDIRNKSKEAVLNYLYNFWKENKYKGVVFLNGTITRVFQENKSGFITSTEGKQYYFRINNFRERVNKFAAGDKVKFNFKESIDKTKGTKSLEAIDITAENC